MPYEIKEPCKEGWDKMKPVPGGRFCDRCQKKVHDLTKGAILPNTGESFCGRIYQPEIARANFSRLNWKQNIVHHFLLMVIFFFSRNANAQIKSSEARDRREYQDQNSTDTVGKEILISGILEDKETKEPIPFAAIVAYDQNNIQLGVVTTDLDGLYKLRLTNIKGKHISLKAAYVGYQSIIIDNIPLTSAKKQINIKLTNAGVIEGLIIMGNVNSTPIFDEFGSARPITREQWNHSPK